MLDTWRTADVAPDARISLEEILQAVRGPQDGRIDAPVQSVMASVRSSVHEGLKGRNLAGLVDESAPS